MSKPRFASDRAGSHCESVRVQGIDGPRAHNVRWAAARHDREAWMQAHGREIYTSDSRSCTCGKPALRVFKNQGWCKACYAEHVR